MNGTTKGFFPSGRGLHQGDPLPPYLFILVEEVLSKLIQKNFDMDLVKPFSHPRGAPLVSHLFYVDDAMIFSNGGMSSLRRVRDIFRTYESWSGQVVSWEKSLIFFLTIF